MPGTAKGVAMLDRFTDRARRILRVASREVRPYEHAPVVTLHILVGMLLEPGGVAGCVLRELGVDLRQARRALAQASPEPGVVFVDNVACTRASADVLDLAAQERDRLGHHYVGTEHLLLGLCLAPACAAVELLLAQGLPPATVRAEVLDLIGFRPSDWRPPPQV